MRIFSSISENLPINLNRFLKTSGIKLLFVIEAFADLKATKGLIHILGIDPKHAIIRYNDQVDRKLVKEILPGFSLTTRPEVLPQWFVIKFDDSSPLSLQGDKLVVNPDPYKYFFPTSVSRKERTFLRKVMGVENGRKIIALSSPKPEEIRQVIKAYKKIQLLQKPLLIIGLREPHRYLKEALVEKGFKVCSRNRLDHPISSWGQKDIVVLNTMGELFHFLKAADLAIVGYDRNLFEPTVLKIPILYFSEPLKMSPKAERLMKLFGLVWKRNSTIKNLLKETRGALPIDPGRLHRQMESVLFNPSPIIRGTKECIRRLYWEVLPEARRKIFTLVTLGVLKRVSQLPKNL